MDNHKNTGDGARLEQLKELVRKCRAAEKKLNGNPALHKEWIEARDIMMGFRGVPEHDALVDAYLLEVRTLGCQERMPARKALTKYYINLLRKTPLKPRKRKPKEPDQPPSKKIQKLVAKIFKYRALIEEAEKMNLEELEEKARSEFCEYAYYSNHRNKTLTRIMSMRDGDRADREFERYIKRVHKFTLKAK
jgi:hypothetical protein